MGTIETRQDMASRNIKTLTYFVGNIPWTVSKVELREYFSKFGPVKHAQIIYDKDTMVAKGFGFVEFATREGADGAMSQAIHPREGSNLNVKPRAREQGRKT